MAGIRLLLIEDHEVTLSGLKNAFAEDADIEVVGQAMTAADGLSLAQELEPEIILLDLHLPDSKGPSHLVKLFVGLGKSKVVVFSGDDRRAIRDSMLEIGVAGYLLKSDSLRQIGLHLKDIAGGQTGVVSTAPGENTMRLTTTESQLLRFLARGKKYQEIAEQRFVSPLTVRKQTELLIHKLGLQTREELISWAVERGYSKLEIDP
jgi:two-component system, NarL family, nitrate/nitrite response regulator NarL